MECHYNRSEFCGIYIGGILLGINRAARVNSKELNIEEEKSKVELAYIEAALRQSGGRKTEAWQLLGLKNRFALRRKVIRLAEKYPHLIEELPLIKKAFFKSNRH